MRKLFIAGVGIAALGVTPALAADIAARPVKAPIAAPYFDTWSGIYAGLSIGARWTETDWTTTCLQPTLGTCAAGAAAFPTRIVTDNPSNFDMTGIRVGGYLGWNWQISNWVIGLEGDIAWADNEETHAGIPGTFVTPPGPGLDIARVRDTWDASIRARVGWLMTPTWLIYATGGVAFLHKEVSATCGATLFPVGWCIGPNGGSASDTLTGWTLGAGVEFKLARNWIIRGEYRYTDYDSLGARFFANVPADTIDLVVDQKTHTAYLGISYLFNWAAPGAVR
jgi:outer membrane immunogenic protein